MMKFNKLIHMSIIVISFFISSVLAAPIVVDMTSGIWTITASDTANNDWSGSTITFETQTANNENWLLSGYFEWKSDTGFFGRENFTGTLFSDRTLQLEGTELVPPINNIILGQYFSELASSNNDIINGTWRANTPFIPTNGWTATRSVTPISNNECIANYKTDGSLNIPCVSVSDVSGINIMYRADLQLIPLSTPFSFELTDAQQIDRVTNNCVATYSTNEGLNIPCVLVPDEFGGTVMYEADMELVLLKNEIGISS